MGVSSSLLAFVGTLSLECLFNIWAACIAGSLSGVSTKSGIAAGGWRGIQGPFSASINETASYPGGILSQLPYKHVP